jgi:FtsZ-binding cell division protein ZapB
MKLKSILLVLSIVFFTSNLSVFSAGIPEVIRVKIQIDNKTAKVNDKVITLDAPPTIINNKTFVPLRFISEAFGAKVQWDSSIRMITIDLDNPEFYQNKAIEMETEINTLNDTITDRDVTIKNLSTDIKKKSSEISSLKEKNSNLENDIVNLKSEIENLKNQIENLKNGDSGIEYRNIQIFVDGKKAETTLEPFIYKGKVFASLEDICKPFGKTWKWDSQKNIFYINEKSNNLINRIEISPSSTTLAPNSSIQFTATGFDDYNNVIENLRFTWSISPTSLGNINDGLFTANSSLGSGVVMAEAFGMKGTADITISKTNLKVDRLVITPSSATAEMGSTVQFTATGYDSSNNKIPNITIFWSVTPTEIGQITSNGLFTGKSKGNGVIMASIQEGKSAIATITVKTLLFTKFNQLQQNNIAF